MNKTSKAKDLTTGSIFKALLVLAVPIMLSSFLQTAYNLTDTFWVGRLGAEAVGAVSLSFPIIFLISSLGGGLAVAGTILVSQYKGKQDQQAVDHIAGQTFLMMFLISIIVGTIGYIFTPILIRLLSAPPEVFPLAVSYLRVSFFGMLFMFIYYSFESMLRGIGNARTPVYIVLATVFLNLILDPLFIFGYKLFPAMGVSGAALATVCTQALAAFIGIYLLLTNRYGINLRAKTPRLDLPLIKKMFFLGLPASIEQSARALSFVFLTVFAAHFGTISLAAYGIRNRISSFLIMPAIGISIAVSAVVGQNLGAKKVDRARRAAKISLWFAFLFLTGIGAIFFIFAKPIIGLFIPNDPAVIASGAYFLRITAMTFGLLAVEIVVAGILRGAGATLTAMTQTILALWIFHIPLAYILSYHTPLNEVGIWWSFAIANLTGALLGLAILKFIKWDKKNLTDSFDSVSTRITEEVISDEGLSS